MFSLILKEPAGDFLEDSSKETLKTDFEPVQKSVNSVNSQIILERNIFNPANFNMPGRNLNETFAVQPSKPVVRKQLELRLLGTVAGDEKIACAIVEDIKTKVQDLYKTGDVIQGAIIEKIERNRIIILNEGIPEILNLFVAGNESSVYAGTQKSENEKQDVSDVIKVTSPAAREVNKKAFLAKIGGIEAVMKTVEVTPHTVNGKADGLRISGLEGLSMASFVGLENGDVIQTINGQTVTDNRKAFQVLKKARALSSLDMQLMRGEEKKTLSFKIN
ncbi:MAG: hypothetical protein JW787_17640 [Sedimentisphaerales bacterium]|nr:hypothetical protein [Sedimentisphaerales bacterium]